MLRCGKMSAKLLINLGDFMPEKNIPFFQNEADTAKGCVIYFML